MPSAIPAWYLIMVSSGLFAILWLARQSIQ